MNKIGSVSDPGKAQGKTEFSTLILRRHSAQGLGLGNEGRALLGTYFEPKERP